ncbi:unnamed protein product [Urochloa decumbens]|uniref:Uncharacterized protein n=1 Tax=Urochloa decumbens TaxID=240449 RepID=A0ABC9FWI4_9POAL
MPTMTVPSAAMRRLRREGLEISRKRASLAPTGGVTAKKPSPPPPNTFVLALPAPPPPRPSPAAHTTTTRPPAPRRAAGGDGGARLERARPAVPHSASARSRHGGAAAPAQPEPVDTITSRRVGKGAQVRVRTRVGTARSTGQPIVLWLRAVVDSAAADDDDGCLRITYSHDINGKLPRVARVSPSDVRLHDVAPRAGGTAASSAGYSSAVTSDDRSARPAPKQSKAAAPRSRPTVAGKKLPLLKKFEEEMKSRSNAIIGCQCQ